MRCSRRHFCLACPAAFLAAAPRLRAKDLPTPRRAVPILCPRALTDAEVADVHQKAFSVEPADAEVWFVAVVYTDRSCFHAEVFFKPEASSRRLRRGRYASLPDGQWLRRQDVYVGTYAHVSPPDQPFGERLDVPEPVYIPFMWPKLCPWVVEGRERREGEERVPLAGDDVVRLIDAARARYDGGGPGPICNVRHEQDDTIHVAFGVSGHGGSTVILKRGGPQGFRVVDGVGWSGGMY